MTLALKNITYAAAVMGAIGWGALFLIYTSLAVMLYIRNFSDLPGAFGILGLQRTILPVAGFAISALVPHRLWRAGAHVAAIAVSLASLGGLCAVYLYPDFLQWS